MQWRPRLVVVATFAMVTVACSSDPSPNAIASNSATPTTRAPATTTAVTATARPPTTSTAGDPPLSIMVTNDDGYDSAGLDAVVEYLRKLDGVTVTVVAPATNESGSGDKTTDGKLTVKTAKTASGYRAKAVEGYPADTVHWALDGGMAAKPDLVVSGANAGQNYATLIDNSGTIGAAATAAREGVPAIALSQGEPADGQHYDFKAGVAALKAYLAKHLGAIRDGDGPMLVSINVPTCPKGKKVKAAVYERPAEKEKGRDFGAPSPCNGKPAKPTDDVDAFNAGHVVITNLDPDTLEPLDD